MKEALKIPDVDERALKAKGFSDQDAEGVIAALDTYGNPESTTYLSMIQGALRRLLQDDGIDFGLPGDAGAVSSSPEKTEADAASNIAAEDLIMNYLDEMDDDVRGVSMDDLIRLGMDNGITPEIIEEAFNSLMEKGMAYEPNLGYLKKI